MDGNRKFCRALFSPQWPGIPLVRGKDKRWTLYRIKETSDQGKVIGTYQSRRDASKALDKIAYASNPKWRSGWSNHLIRGAGRALIQEFPGLLH